MFFFVMKRAALPVEFLKYLEFLYQGVPPSHKYTILMKKPWLKKSFAKFLSHWFTTIAPFSMSHTLQSTQHLQRFRQNPLPMILFRV